ncbi:MAG: helix-turn-helix transcriptional regulator [Akkermansiaceae bacterium]|nr:helix-turn-helix transcriptional regulator [Armatimonadota bacterium]
MTHSPPLLVGNLLREWRQRRRMSQMELSFEAEVSTRHLSFVETGRATPSREMVMLLAERLDVPLRERNALLIAAGFAPVFPTRTLADPALAAAREAVEMVLTAHEPYPALAIDRHWTLVTANEAARRLLGGIAPELLKVPVNVMRLSMHPAGLAPRIANFRQWRSHLLARLRHQIEITADPLLRELAKEVGSYPVPKTHTPAEPLPGSEVANMVVPLHLVTDSGVLSLLSTTTVFGTAVEVTISEIALENFYPMNADSAALLHRLAEE